MGPPYSRVRGLSVGAGAVDWKTLLKPIAKELELDIDRVHDLVSLAQYHRNTNQNRAQLNRRLIDEFADLDKPSVNHTLIARLPISTYWTTNYDHLIEDALRQEHRKPEVKYSVKHLTRTKAGRDAVVYKMHGDVDAKSDAVLIKDDYETYHRDRTMFLTALAGDLVSKTFLFLGFSFTDPNIDYILSRVRLHIPNEAQRQHYAIIKSISKDDCEDEAEFLHKSKQQEYFISDLARFGVKALMIDDYNEITEILTAIDKLVRSNAVLISGAADDYGRWDNKGADIFIRNLSGKIIKWGYKIVSGFGLGVGSSVITGAVQQIYNQQDTVIGKKLLLRPFPQGEDHKEMWPRYRKDLVSHAGVALFIFGNKIENGKQVMSTGMIEEFHMAHEAGAYVIPVGATGFVAKELWECVMQDFDKYYPDHPDLVHRFEELGDETKNEEQIIQTLKKIMDAIQEQ
jgi:hypothetical protein